MGWGGLCEIWVEIPEKQRRSKETKREGEDLEEEKPGWQAGWASSAMLEHLSWRARSLLSLSLASLALALSILALSTSYWCVGMHKVVKPLCLSPVKMKNCGPNTSQPLTTESSTPDGDPTAGFNRTAPPLNNRQPVDAVHYIWETGEDKYTLRYFHTGFWKSCEKHSDGERCRSFMELTPGESQGVLWLSVVSEIMHIGLLTTGFILMWMEMLCVCLRREMYALKVNAFAAVCTILSGLMGMVAHMMYTTVFQLTVTIGPKDWRPQTWDYGWSFALAWISFGCCMASAVFTLNSYTKTAIEQHHRLRARLEDSHSRKALPYNETLPGDGVYSFADLPYCPNGVMGLADGVGLNAGDAATLVLLGGCEGCEDCEREMDIMAARIAREREVTLC